MSPSSQPASSTTLAERAPSRAIPLLYFGLAHCALVLALAAVTIDPARFAGFFYHPRMTAVVHLITLGWISASILGAIYIVSPLALRMPLPARRADAAAFVLFAAGTAGMVAHLWTERFGGIAWSGTLAAAGIGLIALRVAAGLPGARVPLAVKVHVGLAFVNILGAAAMGVLIGYDKSRPLLSPLASFSSHGVLVSHGLSSVFAHAHLAAIGWAGMMVAGTGYRLVPMVLPSAMPASRSLWASAILLQAGSAGVFAALVARSTLLPWFALSAVCGFGAFLAHVVWMKRRPRPAPRSLPRPDFGTLHAMQAMGYLAASCAMGLALSILPASTASLKWAAVYGVCGLLGFLSQMVLGIGARLLPMFAAVSAIVHEENPSAAPAHEGSIRVLRGAAFALWTSGVPLVAGALYAESDRALRAGAALLLAAAIVSALATALVARQAYTGHTSKNPRKD